MNDGGPYARQLADGRLHLQHGPIDLLIRAEGDARAVARGYGAAIARFDTLLGELVAELRYLRTIDPAGSLPAGSVARRMRVAVRTIARTELTPMAAVAGSVADEILAVMRRDGTGLTRVFVNNGGDIAVWQSAGPPFRIATAVPDGALPGGASYPACLEVDAQGGIAGVATSGWRGRSLSLGIADAVTVLAATAASADAAATLIANAVNADAAEIVRCPACELDPDSDLGDRRVTVSVGMLEPDVIDTALTRGAALARALTERGAISAALLLLAGQHRHVDGAYKPGTLATDVA